MKKLFVFLIVPFCTILFNIFYFDTISQVLSSLIYMVVNFGFSFVCYKLFNEKHINLNSSKFRITILIAVLTIADQILKIIINLTQASVGIISNLFRIKISKNINQMAALNLFGIELNPAWIIVLKFVLIILLIIAFIKIKNKNNNHLYAFILLMPAAIDNLIDSLSWGYTLDYIYFYRLVCYDLKDFYVDTAIGYLIIAFLFEKSKQKTVN